MTISKTLAQDPATYAQLLERLRAHRMIGGAPRQELDWLIAHGEFRRHMPGEVVAPKDRPAAYLYVVFSGRIVVHLEHGTGRRHTMESLGGTVTGVLPYSRMQQPINDAVAEEATEVLAIHRDLVPEMIRECPEVTAILVHTMLDRARRTTAMTWQDEKLQSLGRLAAGLAHELNNPASAATRGAKLLREELGQLAEAARAFGTSAANASTDDVVSRFIDRCLATSPSISGSPIERVEREDQLLTWFEARGLTSWSTATLADHGVSPRMLDELASALPPGSVEPAVRWLASALAARSLLSDVERATGRIYDLVAAVRRFSSLDRGAGPEPVDVAKGVRDTIAVWAARSREQGTTVVFEAPDDLPAVNADAGALNQVWSNLLENALDAVQQGGNVAIAAASESGRVVVRIVDDGPGITPEVQARMFDPFFTTKGVGKGVGLGLDIARRVVREHEGVIGVESRPGRTELRVTLPALR